MTKSVAFPHLILMDRRLSPGSPQRSPTRRLGRTTARSARGTSGPWRSPSWGRRRGGWTTGAAGSVGSLGTGASGRGWKTGWACIRCDGAMFLGHTDPVTLDVLTFRECCQYNKNSSLGSKLWYKLPHSSLHTIIKAFQDTCHPHEASQVAPDQGQDKKRALDGLQKYIN